MSTPLVSVLLTTYNREAYVASAIESVLAQTFTDFELVVVDDGSTDRTVEIARTYEGLDARVRVVVNPHNIGQFENRNQAAELARGTLLKYHDSDDLMYPHCLAVMVPMLLSEPTAAFGLSSGQAWPGGPCPMLLTPQMAYQREFLGGGLFMCGPGGALFRAEAFHALGRFPLGGPHSDALFWLHACALVPSVLFPADLFWYRIHSGQHLQSETGRYDEVPLFKAFWNALDDPTCPLTTGQREQARRNRAYVLAKKLLMDVRRGRWRLAVHRWRYSGLGAGDWLRYLRPPRRAAFAGTPVGPDGEFNLPAWARPRGGTTRPA
jgi:Glycosyl transferase family 2